MAGLTVLRGRVTRIESGLPYVEVRELGTGYAFGPLEVSTPASFEVGSRVLVAAIGDSREDLVVVGVVGSDVAPTGPAGGDLEGSYPAPTLRAAAVHGIGDARYSQSTRLAQNGATAVWIRVATVNGSGSTQGHAMTLLVSGQGSIASAAKVVHLVTFGQRGSNGYAFQARQFGTLSAGVVWTWHVKQISELVFELWAKRGGYDAAASVQVLASSSSSGNTVLNLDSVTTVDPGGLTALAAPVQVDLVDAAAATPSLRSLGTGAVQAAAGDHLHDDQYTPTSQMVLAAGAHAPTARPEAYPVGFSTFGSSATGWPEQYGTVSTEFHSIDRAVQRYTAKLSGTVWTRTASSGETTGWTAWRELAVGDHRHDDLSAKPRVTVCLNNNGAASSTRTGTPTIDGYQTVAGDRVLLIGEAPASSNGVWELPADGGAWTRPAGFATAADVAGMLVTVARGTTYGGRTYRAAFKSTDTVGSTAMLWTEVAPTSTWTDYTPTVISMNPGSGGTVVGRYIQMIGKTVHFRARVTLGTGFTLGPGPGVSLPVAPHSTAPAISLNGRLVSTGSNSYFSPMVASTSGGDWYAYWYALGSAGGAYANVTATNPFTWKAGDMLEVAGTYESAY